MNKPLSYLFAYLLPISVLISFELSGWIAYFPVYIYFLILPVLELILKPADGNLEKSQNIKAKKNPWFTLIICLALPFQILVLVVFLLKINELEFASPAFIAACVNMGLVNGILGINVGHELGHSKNKIEERFGEILLLLSLNSHFKPYHNMGHHYDVATRKDPATARKNEWLFLFWIRSHFMSYFYAWQLENKRVKTEKGLKKLSKNYMIVYSLFSLLLTGTIYFLFGGYVLLGYLLSVVLGILLLETVNYIEHYGLLRNKISEKRFERPHVTHSWNSNHILGRVTLFNLSRHSDHHHKVNKKYQNLMSLEESPQLPTGYPGMMLLAFVPPLFFSIMNPKLNQNE